MICFVRTGVGIRAADLLSEEQRLSDLLLRYLADAARTWRRLPSKPVIITFDGAFESVRQFAKPILDHAGYKAVMVAIGTP
jgi:hypothetical protein